jgi:tRNA(Met) C34 N-acetyltransferase TmcA
MDEVAATQLSLVNNFFRPYLVFKASTINSYENTGLSLVSNLFNKCTNSRQL